MEPKAPVTLEALKKLTGLDAVLGASAYIANGETKMREARDFRDAELAHLASEVGMAEAARLTRLSYSTVKIARGKA